MKHFFPPALLLLLALAASSTARGQFPDMEDSEARRPDELVNEFATKKAHGSGPPIFSSTIFSNEDRPAFLLQHPADLTKKHPVEEFYQDFVDASGQELGSVEEKLLELKSKGDAIVIELQQMLKDAKTEKNPDAQFLINDGIAHKVKLSEEVEEQEEKLHKEKAAIENQIRERRVRYHSGVGTPREQVPVSQKEREKRGMEEQAGTTLSGGYGSIRNTTECNMLSPYSAMTTRVFELCDPWSSPLATAFSKNVWYNETAANALFDKICQSTCVAALTEWVKHPSTSSCWYFPSSQSIWRSVLGFCKKNPDTGKRCGVELRQGNLNLVGGTSSSALSDYPSTWTYASNNCTRQTNYYPCNETKDRLGNPCYWSYKQNKCLEEKTDALMTEQCGSYCYKTYAAFTRTDISSTCRSFEGVWCAVYSFKLSYTDDLQQNYDGSPVNASYTAQSCSVGARMCHRYAVSASSTSSAYSSFFSCQQSALYNNISNSYCVSNLYSSFNTYMRAAAKMDGRCGVNPDNVACSTMWYSSSSNPYMTYSEYSAMLYIARYQTDCTSTFYTSTSNTSNTLIRYANMLDQSPYRLLPIPKCCHEQLNHQSSDFTMGNWLIPDRTYYIDYYSSQRNYNRTLWTPATMNTNYSALPGPSTKVKMTDAVGCLSNISATVSNDAITSCSPLSVGGTTSDMFQVTLNVNWTKIEYNFTLIAEYRLWFAYEVASVLKMSHFYNIRDVTVSEADPDLVKTQILNGTNFTFKVWSRDPVVVQMAKQQWEDYLSTKDTIGGSNFWFSSTSNTVTGPMCSNDCRGSDYYLGVYGLGQDWDDVLSLTVKDDDIPEDNCFTQDFYDLYADIIQHCVLDNETYILDDSKVGGSPTTQALYYNRSSGISDWNRICNGGKCASTFARLAKSSIRYCFPKAYQVVPDQIAALCSTGDSGHKCGIAYTMARVLSGCHALAYNKTHCNWNRECKYNELSKTCDANPENDFVTDMCDGRCTKVLVSSLMNSPNSNQRDGVMILRAFCPVVDRLKGDLCLPAVRHALVNWHDGTSDIGAINNSIATVCSAPDQWRCLRRIYAGYSSYFISKANTYTRQVLSTYYTNPYKEKGARYHNMARHFCDKKTDDGSTAYCTSAFAWWNQKDSCLERITQSFGETFDYGCNSTCANAQNAANFQTLGCCAGTMQTMCGSLSSSYSNYKNLFSVDTSSPPPYLSTADPTPAPPTPVPPPTPAPTATAPPTTSTPLPPTPAPTATPAGTNPLTYDYYNSYLSHCVKDLSSCQSVANTANSNKFGSPYTGTSALNYRCSTLDDYAHRETCADPFDCFTRLSLKTGIKWELLVTNRTENVGQPWDKTNWWSRFGNTITQDISTNLGIDTTDIIAYNFTKDLTQRWIKGQTRPNVPVFGRRRQMELDDPESSDSGAVFNFYLWTRTKDYTAEVATDFQAQKDAGEMFLPLTNLMIYQECDEMECTLGTADLQAEGASVSAADTTSGVSRMTHATAFGAVLLLLLF